MFEKWLSSKKLTIILLVGWLLSLLYSYLFIPPRVDDGYYLKNTEELSENVLSLPIHSEIENSSQDFIIEKVLSFF